MSSNRGGFFSLNRLLRRKNKNESSNNLTKSSVQTLTRSTTNLEVIGPQNQIKPLTAVHNAPFEQTFRITVSLPHGQLYVARIGAKTKLSELLDMIATNKLLDASKFEFRHPTDEAQVYDLSCTIGEVGLNEIKLVPKNQLKETVKLRTHLQNEIRLAVRPHTMSSVSPYSSTNSLNSSDSSGINANQRHPAAPCRKKRAAPRPPSQNSIPEIGEKVNIPPKIDESADAFKKPLARQDFHVSSPNLSSNLQLCPSTGSSTNTSVSSSFNRKKDETNYKKYTNRPLSMQIIANSVEDQRSSSVSTNQSYNHSRTSSETSDITKDEHYPEPAQRKKLPISKKKAPVPPPRTISSLTTATVLQNLNEECVEDVRFDANHSSVSQSPASTPDVTDKTYNMPNVSKVMLNVEVASDSENKGVNGNTSDSSSIEKFDIAPNRNISKTQIIYRDDNLNVPSEKLKKTSVVSLNMEQNEVFLIPPSPDGTIDTENISEQINEIIEKAVDEHERKMNEDVSQQIDEIIDEAVVINEAKLNAVNEMKNKQNAEINNNWTKDINGNGCDDECSTGKSTPDSTPEIPIKPILNETRTFDFVSEYSDHSLSTTNTMETPSTGPESIITSDIEDGYKGNDDKQRKVEMNREEFIESQFGFLSEHSDGKTSLESLSDADISIKPIQKHDVISSTMIECNKMPNKTNVINELTQIISCNRLETFIKPCNGNDNQVDAKRSSLSNFAIGAYTNGNHEKIQTAKIEESANGHDEIVDKQPKITSMLPKQVIRSCSFHSTNPNVELAPSEQSSGIPLSLAPRSTSYISLVGIQKLENELTENELKRSPQKSSSELSIADIPSLQSIEIMKSILSTSLNFDRSTPPKETKPAIEVPEPIPEPKVIEPVKPVIKAKAWTPPSVNLSTWGERPKSEVFIKSDNDYIFGGVSNKMAALQKRFSGNQDNDARCEKETCKLPIVRSVEYKKNVAKTNGDSTDSVADVAIRPSYEISRLEKSFEKPKIKTMSLNRYSLPPKPVSNGNDIQHNPSASTNGHSEKPLFSQFSLRKTGLKEKILDGNHEKHVINGNVIKNDVKPKLNPMPTAPKPPPPPPVVLKPVKPLKKSISIGGDPRDELLDSIRNFNRNTLKRNCLV